MAHLFHVPWHQTLLPLPLSAPIARNVGRYKVQNLTKEFQMNNRNQNQIRQQPQAPAPAATPAPTYL